MELWSALLGAIVGGLIAGIVAWLQTRVSIRREFELFREGLKADREANRTAYRRVVASEALRALASLDAAMPYMDHRFVRLRQDAPAYLVKRRKRAERALDDLRAAEVAAIPYLGKEMQREWHALIDAADTAGRAGDRMGDSDFAAAAAELQEKASSAHASLVALIDTD